MSYKKQEMLTLPEHMGSLPFLFSFFSIFFFAESALLIFLVFCVVFCMSLSCVLCAQFFPVARDCPFLIAPSVFSNVYIALVLN